MMLIIFLRTRKPNWYLGIHLRSITSILPVLRPNLYQGWSRVLKCDAKKLFNQENNDLFTTLAA